MKSPPAPPASAGDRTAEGGPVAILVWDLPVRLFHWVLVLLLVISWTTGQDGGIDAMSWHLRAGLAVLALLLARIAWGVVGSQTARFASFVRGPRAAWADARALACRSASPHAGHPPLGGWMVIALLGALLVQCATGLFTSDAVMTEGPLASHVPESTREWLSTIHRWNATLLVTLAAVHIAAVVYHRVALRSDLLRGMLTGRRRLPAGTPTPAIRSPWLAVALILAAAGLVWRLLG